MSASNLVITRELSWTPVRRGKIYCAPACGARCTWKEHEDAKSKAAKLARRLDRETGHEGWRPRVWENFGWHYQVIDSSGLWKVNVSRFGKSYFAFLGPKSGGGYWAEPGGTALEAIKNTIAVFDVDLRQRRQYERAVLALKGLR
jgi:hypothetical protein